MFLGVDISTKRVGIGLIDNLENIHCALTYSFSNSHNEQRHVFSKIIKQIKDEFNINNAYFEEVRLISFKGRNFINLQTIYRLHSCITIIQLNDLETYQINARSWKCRILKSHGFDKSKQGSIDYIKYRYGIDYNHDLCDALCIAIYAKRYKDMPKLFK